MSNVTFDSTIASTIASQDSDIAVWQEAAGKLSKDLSQVESDLMKAYKDNDQKKIGELTVLYQKAQRMFEFFMTALKNMHEGIMSVIRKLDR